MPESLRIATFNAENLDNIPGQSPSLSERIAVMRPQLERMRADIICFQEIHGQEHDNQPRDLSALEELISNTPYEGYHMAYTRKDNNEAYNKRNLVILSRFSITESQKIKHDFTPKPRYRLATAIPTEQNAKDYSWERPIFYTKIDLGTYGILHLINLHLKSKIACRIDSQMENQYTWKSGAGWAEGYFLASMKRVGQALETRLLIDNIFNSEGNDSLIAACGDFNANMDSVPVYAIRGKVEDTNNPALTKQVMIPCELTIPESSRYSLLHLGKGEMLDHIIVSRSLLKYYRGAEIHNEVVPDESAAYRTDKKFPESDHAPVIAEFVLA